MATSRSIRPIVLLGMSVIFVTFGVFGGWASVAKLDSAVVAPGTISLESNRKVVQHFEGGLVSEILVEEADVVKEGDVLLRLNNIQARSDLDVLEFRIDLARIMEARLVAERDLADEVIFPAAQSDTELSADLEKAREDQMRAFKDRRQILQSQLNILASRVDQTHEQIAGLEQQRNALERRYENFQVMIDRMRSGEEKGLIQGNLLSQREDAFIQIEADLGKVISEIAQAKNAISESELQSLQVRQEYRERANRELDTLRSEMTEFEQRAKVARDVLARTEITAPASGSIQNLQVHTVGSVIRPGDVLMELVPEDEKLIITARVSPTDIDNVEPGLETEVRFSSFKSRLTPVVLGHVQTVSQDVITPTGSGGEQPYYLARLQVPEEDIPEDIRSRVTAGMPVDVVITTGERRVVTYLTSPLMDAVRKSLIEE
jgi:HlyD family secretion protein